MITEESPGLFMMDGEELPWVLALFLDNDSYHIGSVNRHLEKINEVLHSGNVYDGLFGNVTGITVGPLVTQIMTFVDGGAMIEVETLRFVHILKEWREFLSKRVRQP